MDILAGVVSGLLMGTVFLGAGVFLLVSNPDIYERLAQRFHENMSPTLVMLSIVIAVPPLCGMFGGIAGLLYRVAEDSLPDAGLGSSNLAFTAAILSLATLVVLILLFTRKKAIRLGLIMSIAFAGLFGWILPLLANL